ncbi:MAG: carboxypeptidase regulatory-like domain-containing protein [Planctomycetota bacterium]
MRLSRAFFSRLLIPLLAGLFVSAGCGESGPRMYPARGRVVFSDGDPVRLGTVELLSDEHGTTATGKIEEDGTFVLGTLTDADGAAAGSHRAIVAQVAVFDGTLQHQRDHGDMVDPLFASYMSSPLKVTIRKAERNDIELRVEKARRSKPEKR